MGEMLLGQLKEEMPLVIIRPTIITSTYKEPFPGWVEGIRTIDSLAVGYGKGIITCFLGNPKGIIDVWRWQPHSNDNSGNDNIYHVGSSISNPVEVTWLQDYALTYFTRNPWINKDGKPVIVGKVNVLSSMDSFRSYMTIRYILPLKALQILNILCCQYFQNTYLEMCRKIKFVMRLIDLYRPYLFFKGLYDDINLVKLRSAANECGIETIFYFDPKMVNWEDYFMNAHIPGVVKYGFKQHKA
ncbi:fatty acyl-CoA reductase [Striga asiatica]|uniref:Fatty acyl-CoA reductase n=1 Tax=Striga asiatica TaxID=4170 RepID=A0A5A7PWT0_STRAF|nr:fatty acyl-CoA reductase [Striga asiatica]